MENKLHKSKMIILSVAIFVAMLTFLIAIFGALNPNVKKSSVDSAVAMTIGSVSDFNSFVSRVNGGETFSGKTVELSADINFNGASITPVGTSSNPFKGTFDGKGFKITNAKIGYNQEQSRYLVIDRATYPMYRRSYGLFAYTNNALIKRLYVNNFTITANVESLSELYLGILVGKSLGNLTIDQCIVENCTIQETGTMFSNAAWYSYVDKVELFVGILTGKVESGFSSSKCVVKNSTIDLRNSDSVVKNNYIGGLVGCADSCNISICSVVATFKIDRIGDGEDLGVIRYDIYYRQKSIHNIGGLVGQTNFSSNVSNNYFIGNINLESEYMLYFGGMIGNCAANSEVDKNFVQFDEININNRHVFRKSAGYYSYYGEASSVVNVVSNNGSTNNKYYIGSKIISLAYNTNSAFSDLTKIYDYITSDFTSYTGAGSTNKWN